MKQLFWAELLVIVFLCNTSFAQGMDLDRFIREASPLLGKPYNYVAGKIDLQRKQGINKEVYTTITTGLLKEPSCRSFEFYFDTGKLTSVLCMTNDDVATKVAEVADEKLKVTGRSAGTGYYVWCMKNNTGLDAAIMWGDMTHVGIYKSCPLK